MPCFDLLPLWLSLRLRLIKGLYRSGFLASQAITIRSSGGLSDAEAVGFCPASAFSPDSEAMGFLLQITMSCPCALSRQVAGAVLMLVL